MADVKVVEIGRTGWLGIGKGAQLRKVEKVTAKMLGKGYELTSQDRSSWNEKITLTFVKK